VPVDIGYKVSVTFYDNVGNVVKRFPDDMKNSPVFQSWLGRVNGSVVKDGSTGYLMTSDSSEIRWNGTNRNGRIVGGGTYLAILRIFYTIDGMQKVGYPPQRLKIGVRR